MVLSLAAICAVGGLVAGISPATENADDQAAANAITQGKLPPGYRDWRLISLAHEEGNLHSLGAILGNNVAIEAYRKGQIPYPDGTIIAALHYRHVASEENNKIFGKSQSFIPGAPTNTQFMIKDSTKYASTGGWYFAHFNTDGKAVTDAATLRSCYECHAREKDRDLVFTQYAP